MLHRLVRPWEEDIIPTGSPMFPDVLAAVRKAILEDKLDGEVIIFDVDGVLITYDGNHRLTESCRLRKPIAAAILSPGDTYKKPEGRDEHYLPPNVRFWGVGKNLTSGDVKFPNCVSQEILLNCVGYAEDRGVYQYADYVQQTEYLAAPSASIG